MAQPTFVQAIGQPFPYVSGSSGTTYNLTVGTLGSAPSSSNVVFLFVLVFAGAGTSLSIATPSGWTAAGTHTISATGNGLYPTVFACFWRTGFTSTSQVVTITVGPTNTAVGASGTMIEVAGASTTAPIDPNSGFLGSDGSFSATGTATGPNLAASITNTFAIATFFSNDDYAGFIGPRSGWTERGYSSGAIGGLPSLEAQTYNSIPAVGTAVQTSATIDNVDSPPVTWNAYELFVAPPASGVGHAANYDAGFAHYTGGMN